MTMTKAHQRLQSSSRGGDNSNPVIVQYRHRGCSSRIIFATVVTITLALNLFMAQALIIPAAVYYHGTIVTTHRPTSPALTIQTPFLYQRTGSTCTTTRLWQLPPPGSGYIGPGDEMADPHYLPDTYQPIMGYPGTMRPGSAHENVPYQDLPISDDDPDPVPWPHFQEIQWHHRWEPPHAPPVAIEDVIDMAGRWATPEQEAAFRAGARSTARAMQKQAEAKKRDWVITDDEDEDDIAAAIDGDILAEPLLLGDSIFGALGTDEDRALTEEAVSPKARAQEKTQKQDDSDEGLDDFFSNLGLDLELGDEPDPPLSKAKRMDDDDDDGMEEENFGASPPSSASVSASIVVEADDDDELSALGLDDEDDVGEEALPLEDFDSDEFDGTEDFFDEGGFDIADDGGDFDGGGGDW